MEAVPVNLATEEELTTISGIGPVLAQKIISFRDRVGQFSEADDLLHISGIGPARADWLSRQLSFEKK